MILTADIGGTNARFTCFSRETRSWKKLFSARYCSRDYASLEAAVRCFLDDCDHDITFEASCFSLAGPVRNGICEMANLGWKENADELKDTFGKLGRVFFINDIKALCYGIAGMKTDGLVSLTPQIKGENAGNKAVIAPGTGCGEGAIIGNEPVAGEGGHADFAPRSEEEIQLLRFFRKENRHVSYDKVLGGGGLLKIAKFAAEEEGVALTQKTPEEVSRAAMEGESVICTKALRMYTDILGAEAGNMALKIFAEGGVFLAGGIPRAILSELRRPHFLSSFSDKGRFRRFLESIPVYVIVDHGLQMQGCLHYVMLSV